MIHKLTFLGIVAGLVLVGGTSVVFAAPGDSGDVFSPLDRDAPGDIRPSANHNEDDLLPGRQPVDNEAVEDVDAQVSPPMQTAPTANQVINGDDNGKDMADIDNEDVPQNERHEVNDDNDHNMGPPMQNPMMQQMPSANMGPGNGGNDSRGGVMTNAGPSSMGPSNSMGAMMSSNSGENSRGGGHDGGGSGGHSGRH